MGKNYDYHFKLNANNPRHMRAAELLDHLGRGALGQYIVDSVLLAETVTSQQKAAEAPDLPAAPQLVQPQPISQAAAEPPTQAGEQHDPQAEQRAWATESLSAWGK